VNVDLELNVVSTQAVESSTSTAGELYADGAEQTCPAELALRAVELSLEQDNLNLYQMALDGDRQIALRLEKNPIFHTWKKYKLLVQQKEQENTSGEQVGLNCDAVSPTLQLDCTEAVEDEVNKDKRPVATQPQALSASHFYSSKSSEKQPPSVSSVVDANFPFNNSSFPSDVDSDILPYPQHFQDRPLKKKTKEHYFVLTAQEVYASKLAAAEEKKRNSCRLRHGRRLEKKKLLQIRQEKTKTKIKLLQLHARISWMFSQESTKQRQPRQKENRLMLVYLRVNRHDRKEQGRTHLGLVCELDVLLSKLYAE